VIGMAATLAGPRLPFYRLATIRFIGVFAGIRELASSS
jgi:hypothetical protein